MSITAHYYVGNYVGNLRLKFTRLLIVGEMPVCSRRLVKRLGWDGVDRSSGCGELTLR